MNKKIKKIKKIKKDKSIRLNMKVPQMFSDVELDFKEALKYQKISQFKNLGTMSEKHFSNAGIKTPKQFISLGWKKTWDKLAKIDYKNTHTLYGYTYLIWIHIDWCFRE